VTRWLFLVRHAQAESFAETDHARALTVRGREDAAATGRWLRVFVGQHGGSPDAAVVSDAVRARQTWEALADAAGWDVVVRPDRALYVADPAAAIDLVRVAEPSARSLVVVGHDPTIGVLVQLLQDGEGDPGAVEASMGGHPTAAVAAFEVAGEWADLDEGGATLRAFHTGRA
jgi:phosphohistidine phosphatase